MFAEGDASQHVVGMARTGDGESAIKAQQFAGPRATLSVGSNPDGGLLAPVEWDRTITDKLKIVSAMRTLARVISISSTGFTKVYNDRATASGWVGETTARPGTGNAQYQQATFTTGEPPAKVSTSAICRKTRKKSRMLSALCSAKLSAQSPP